MRQLQDRFSSRANNTCSTACELANESRLTAALEVAQFAVKQGQESHDLPYFRMVLGMADYRNGHYAAAEEALLAAEKGHEDDPELGVISGFYRAMSLYRQGKQDEARELATSTAKKMKPFPTNEKNPFAGNATTNDLVSWLACKEADGGILFRKPFNHALLERFKQFGQGKREGLRGSDSIRTSETAGE